MFTSLFHKGTRVKGKRVRNKGKTIEIDVYQTKKLEDYLVYFLRGYSSAINSGVL
jgi:hypothetical protein